MITKPILAPRPQYLSSSVEQATKMALSTGEKNLVKTAGYLGIVQALAWSIMALICIVVFYRGVAPDNRTSYIEEYSLQLYNRFLNKFDNTSIVDAIVYPSIFVVFTWIEFVSNLAWLTVSVLQLSGVNGQGSTILNINKIWSAIVWLSSIVDLVFIILLGIDYNACAYTNYSKDVEGSCIQVYIPVIVIIAKGFILWIANLILSVVLFKISNSPDHKTFRNRLLSADNRIPRVKSLSRNPSPVQTPKQIYPNNSPNSPGYNNNNYNNGFNNYWGSQPGPGTIPASPPPDPYYNNRQPSGGRY